MKPLSIRSRDGVEQVEVDGDHITVAQLKTLIEEQLQIPVQSQTLSTKRNLIFAETPSDILALSDMADPNLRIKSSDLDYGCVVYLLYEGERDDQIDDQMLVSRQDKSHCDSVSLDHACLTAFRQYVKESPVKRGGFMYGTVSDGQVKVDFIYEPEQYVYEDRLILDKDPYEEGCADAIAHGLGMRKVGFIFNQTKEYTLSNADVLLASRLQGMSDLKEWATVVVKLETSEERGDRVQIEAFQMSDICVRLLCEGWLETEITPDDDPKLSKMTKEVLVGAERLKLVDNDIFLVKIKTNKILEHKGLLLCAFQIENRNTQALVWDLRARINGPSNLPFAERISDFHLLLFASKFLKYTSQVTALADCVRLQSRDPKKYELLINTLGVNPC